MKKYTGLIVSIVAIALLIGSVVLFTQPYYVHLYAAGRQEVFSGYYFVQHLGMNNITDRMKVVGIGIIFGIVATAVMLIIMILNLLKEVKVLKNPKFILVLRVLTCAGILLYLAASLMWFVGIIAFVNEQNSSAINMGWAATINFIQVVVAALCSVYLMLAGLKFKRRPKNDKIKVA